MVIPLLWVQTRCADKSTAEHFEQQRLTYKRPQVGTPAAALNSNFYETILLFVQTVSGTGEIQSIITLSVFPMLIISQAYCLYNNYSSFRAREISYILLIQV